MQLITEYLFIVDKSSSAALYRFCEDESDFERMLGDHEKITFARGKLIFEEQFEFPYKIHTTQIAGKEQRCFYFSLSCDGDESVLEKYEGAIRAVRTTAQRQGSIPETIWDDISLHYSELGYPLIHKAESLMRKLITYFMLTTVGKEWVAETSPTAFKEALEKSKRKQQSDVLHQADFIQLGDFLFKAYPNRDPQHLLALIAKTRATTDLRLEELQLFVPRSNWERYFAGVVKCEDEYLNKRWKELYDLRCKIAHNALVGREDFKRIQTLLREVEPVLQSAIKNLGKVEVPPEEKDQVAENAAATLSAAYGDFLLKWKDFESALSRLAEPLELEGSRAPRSATTILKDLLAENVIEEDFYKSATGLTQFRNRVVHSTETPPAEQALLTNATTLAELTAQLERQMGEGLSWSTELSRALEALGGEASLAEIYDYIEAHSARDLTENWRAITRFNLQKNTPGTKTYNRGGSDLFRRVSTGRYALRPKIDK